MYTLLSCSQPWELMYSLAPTLPSLLPLSLRATKIVLSPYINIVVEWWIFCPKRKTWGDINHYKVWRNFFFSRSVFHLQLNRGIFSLNLLHWCQWSFSECAGKLNSESEILTLYHNWSQNERETKNSFSIFPSLKSACLASVWHQRNFDWVFELHPRHQRHCRPIKQARKSYPIMAGNISIERSIELSIILCNRSIINLWFCS